ncbi:MAG: hypothetical protein AAB903_00320 [Patescibacteria group bacterium]
MSTERPYIDWPVNARPEAIQYELQPSDLSLLVGFPWKQRAKEVIDFFIQRQNQPASQKELQDISGTNWFNPGNENREFAAHHLPFRILSLSYADGRYGGEGLYQYRIFKVRPKQR